MVSGWNTGLVVPARAHSSRLPNKMLLEIEGRPALSYLLERMSAPLLPDVRVVCTSQHPDDDPIAKFALEEGWLSFRGSEEDVLQRYLDAATAHGLELIVNVDGDDLFADTRSVDTIIRHYREVGADFIRIDGLPFGGTPTGIKVDALRHVCSWKQEMRTQGWAKYFVESGLYHVVTIPAPEELRRPTYRMTLDYVEDVAFFSALIAELRRTRGGSLDLTDAISVLDQRPDIVAISTAVNERYWERFEREHGRFAPPAPARTLDR